MALSTHIHTYLCLHPTSESNSGSICVCVCVCGGRPAGFQCDPPHQDGGGEGREWRAGGGGSSAGEGGGR